MPTWIRGPELIIILIIVVLLFGVGRLGRIGGELGRSIREFRSSLRGDEEDQEAEDISTDEPPESS